MDDPSYSSDGLRDPDQVDDESPGGDERPSDERPASAKAQQGDTTYGPVPSAEFQAWRSRKLPGPGLPEAGLWFLGGYIVHVVSAVILAVLAGVYLAITGQLGSQQLNELPGGVMVFILTGEMSMFVLAAVGCAALRFRGQFRRALPLPPPTPLHLVLLVLLLLPVSIVSGQIYELVDRGLWKPLVELVPLLQRIDSLNTMNAIGEIARQTPFVVLLLAIAVAPAIGEEVIFRGVIGRGLIARWGLIGGMLWTSLLFALFHLHPVHAAGVLLLGFVMHVLYLATRSFWAPMLFHFLNNAWAATWTKFGELEANEDPTDPDSMMVALCLAAIVSMLWFLWQTRTEYIDEHSGVTWSPGYPTVEQPPPWIDWLRRRRRASRQLTWLTLTLTVVCYLSIFGGLIAGLLDETGS